jgi:hypothetical protein
VEIDPDEGVTEIQDAAALTVQFFDRSPPFLNVTVCAGGFVLPREPVNDKELGLTERARALTGL